MSGRAPTRFERASRRSEPHRTPTNLTRHGRKRFARVGTTGSPGACRANPPFRSPSSTSSKASCGVDQGRFLMLRATLSPWARHARSAALALVDVAAWNPERHFGLVCCWRRERALAGASPARWSPERRRPAWLRTFNSPRRLSHRIMRGLCCTARTTH